VQRLEHASPIPDAPAPSATAAVRTPTPVPPAIDLGSLIGVRADLPTNDAIGLAARYRRTFGPAPVAKPFVAEANVGDARDFVVVKLTGDALEGKVPPEVVTISARLMAKSIHAYFYEDATLDVDPAAVQEAANKFEATVWPTVTAMFGEPLTPGVDGDPRIIVLQADLGGAAGVLLRRRPVPEVVRPLSNRPRWSAWTRR
jgi:hypothetical protein